MGTKDRDTNMVTTEVVETTDKETLQGFVEVYTDGNQSYATLWIVFTRQSITPMRSTSMEIPTPTE